jgi:hypothetical protein
VLAQFASAKIQFENPKKEPSAKLMVFLHGEANLSERESTTGQSSLEHEARTASCKSSVECQLPGAPHSSGKELPVHCIDFQCEP